MPAAETACPPWLGLRTIAECVERRATLAELREIGVDFAQRYGLSRPQPLRE